MSDFAYKYFDSELDNLPLPELKKIFEKQKESKNNASSKNINKEPVKENTHVNKTIYVKHDNFNKANSIIMNINNWRLCQYIVK